MMGGVTRNRSQCLIQWLPGYLTTTACILLMGGAVCAQELRITHVTKDNGAPDSAASVFFVESQGADASRARLVLDGDTIPRSRVQAHNGGFKVSLNSDNYTSGPLWIRQGDAASNPVWLSLAGSHVVAATESRVATNMDGLTTYLDLVSVVIEESHDGADEAVRLDMQKALELTVQRRHQSEQH